MNRMNVGTSYFVAPSNRTSDVKTMNVIQKNKHKVLQDLTSVLQKFEAEEEEVIKHMSEEAAV